MPSLLGATRVIDDISLDKYTFIRDAYLQRRRSLVFDGDVPETPAAPETLPRSASGRRGRRQPRDRGAARRSRRRDAGLGAASCRACLDAAVIGTGAAAVNPSVHRALQTERFPFSEQGS